MGLAPSALCEFGAERQITHHIASECRVHRGPGQTNLHTPSGPQEHHIMKTKKNQKWSTNLWSFWTKIFARLLWDGLWSVHLVCLGIHSHSWKAWINDSNRLVTDFWPQVGPEILVVHNKALLKFWYFIGKQKLYPKYTVMSGNSYCFPLNLLFTFTHYFFVWQFKKTNCSNAISLHKSVLKPRSPN